MKPTSMTVRILTLLLLISAGLNVFLFRTTVSFYRKLQAVRLDPLGEKQEKAIPEAVSPDRPRLLLAGDSRAAQWRIPEGFSGMDITNSAIGGQTTRQILERFPHDLQRAQPDRVLIQAGINDLKTLPLFPEQRDDIVAGCKRNLAAMVTRAESSGVSVIVSTIFPPGRPSPARRPVWSSAIPEAVTEVNRFLQTLSGEGVVILDAHSLLSGTDGIVRSEFSLDTLHLNRKGYHLLNLELEIVLDKGINERTSSHEEHKPTLNRERSE